jgi:hypothetical protein
MCNIWPMNFSISGFVCKYHGPVVVHGTVGTKQGSTFSRFIIERSNRLVNVHIYISLNLDGRHAKEDKD